MSSRASTRVIGSTRISASMILYSNYKMSKLSLYNYSFFRLRYYRLGLIFCDRSYSRSD